MQAIKRVSKLLKDHGIRLSDYSTLDTVPIHFKLAVISDLLSHIETNGTGYPTCNTVSLRTKIQKLIQLYSRTESNAPGAWMDFIKAAENVAVVILKEYTKSKEA